MSKTKKMTFILMFFGLHRFYLGKYGTGILYLITLGGFGIWSIIDLYALLMDNMRDAEGNKLVPK